MKNIFILIVLAGLFSCKKDGPKPAQDFSTPTKYYPKGYYDIYVTSNYQYPYVSIEKTGIVIYNLNKSSKTSPVPLYYKLNCNQETKYRAYVDCAKNASDTTMYMLDNNPIWNRLVVCSSNDTLIDTTTIGVYRSAQNQLYWNVK